MMSAQIFYIPLNKQFLEELALGILSRFKNISEISILLPSRRSCIEFEAILQRLLSKSCLMPQIIAIGELGKETQLLEDTNFYNTQKHLSELEHKLYIAQIIYQKKQGQITYLKALDIATSLSDIIIKCTRDKVPLANIKKLPFPDASKHVEELIEYLYLIIDLWPDFLKKNNVVDYLNDNNLYIEHLINRWKNTPPTIPIIAAGSTGSIKSTSNLLQTLSNTPNGFVVLKGIDFQVSTSQWDSVDETHHAFLTKQLIHKIGIDKENLIPWHSKSTTPTSWQGFVSSFMTPSKATIEWNSFVKHENTEDYNIKLIECRNPQEESMLITIRIREILEKTPEANIAIVTNNSDLINRIVALAEIWDISIFNSHGTPLYVTQQCNFVVTILNAISEKFAPVPLLALLKHPQFCIPIEHSKQSIIKLETAFLRGVCRYDSLEQLINIISNDGQEDIAEVLSYIKKYCHTLITDAQNKFVNFKQCIKEIVAVAERLSSSETGSSLWSDSWGQILYKHFYDIIETSSLVHKIRFYNINHILKALLQNKTSTKDIQSNVQILSNIESRLLSFDYLIISGLNEGDWPAKIRFDPWLTNNMSSLLHLSAPEQIIGQAAYDFFCLVQQENILLTRSLTCNSNITTPTRWLVRMETLAQKIGLLDSIKPKNHYLKQWTSSLLYHAHVNEEANNNLAAPTLPNALKKLSVTQVEKLIRDPYSIYISSILGIKKLEPIDKQPDQKDFGIFIHSVMDRFSKLYDTSSNHQQLLKTLSTQILNSITENKIIQHVWKLKFDQISAWILNFEENKRKNNNKKIYTEINGQIHINNEVILTMKADRIEIDNDLITIIDYKTGSVPTQQDIQKGFSPQLPLEALIAIKGIEYIKIKNANIQLLYIQLSPGKNLGKITAVNITPEIMADCIEKGLSDLIVQFNTGTPFLISPRINKAPKYNDIAHLERIEL